MVQSSFNFNLQVFKVIFIQVEYYTFNFYLELYISIDFQLCKTPYCCTTVSVIQFKSWDE